MFHGKMLVQQRVTLHSLLMLLLGPEPFEKLFPWSYPQLGLLFIPGKGLANKASGEDVTWQLTFTCVFFGFELD